MHSILFQVCRGCFASHCWGVISSAICFSLFHPFTLLLVLFTYKIKNLGASTQGTTYSLHSLWRLRKIKGQKVWRLTKPTLSAERGTRQ